jgi:hypothetical protein
MNRPLIRTAHQLPKRKARGVLQWGILVFFLLVTLPASAKQEEKSYLVFMGAGFFYGQTYAIPEKSSDEKWEGGDGYGGGLIFERILSRRFGIHSGIWFGQFTMKISSDDEDGSYSMEARSVLFTIPFYLFLRLNGRSFGADFMAGINFSYISETYLYEGSRGEGRSTNVRPYINTYQFGVGGGIRLRYRITRFIDIFIAGIGERYLTSYVSQDENSPRSLLDFKLQSGVLMRVW